MFILLLVCDVRVSWSTDRTSRPMLMNTTIFVTFLYFLQRLSKTQPFRSFYKKINPMQRWMVPRFVFGDARQDNLVAGREPPGVNAE